MDELPLTRFRVEREANGPDARALFEGMVERPAERLAASSARAMRSC